MSPVTVTIGGVVADPALIPRPLTITHGRGQIGNQPDPPECELEWLDPVFPWTVGDTLTVGKTTNYPPATYDSPTAMYDDPVARYDDDGTGASTMPLFAGTIAGMSAQSAYGQIQGWSVAAVGYQARLGATPVTLTRPVESDIARVQAIAAAAATTIEIRGTSALQLAAGDVDTDALAALHTVCESSGGLLWQQRDGTITYGTARHRDTGNPIGLLPANVIDHGLAWSQSVESIVNQVTVSWGPDDARLESTHTDPSAGTAPWGVRAATVNTVCAAEPDAEALALLILGRRAQPYWGTPEAVVYWSDVDDEGMRLLAALDVSTPVLAPFTTDPGPTPSGPTPAIVEGFIETVDEAASTMQVALSDMARWVVMHVRTYTELAADFPTYTDVAAAGSYIDAAVKEGA